MATLVLSAVGASVGGAVGGSVLGLSSAVVGRAVGATFGRLIDQRILGQGSASVPTGQIDRFHLSGASEGAPIGKTFGRVRVGGQVIWASRFLENVVSSGGGGKGGGSGQSSRKYTYSVSLAIAVGEGEVTRIGRIWADGRRVAKTDLNFRFYPGDETQIADPKIEAVEGSGQAPAFRGTAYVVFEDLNLEAYGNRVPQFSFEVFRSAQPISGNTGPAQSIKGVALIPGTGEYGLATTPVHFNYGPGDNRSANVNSPSGLTDFQTSMEDLRGDLPSCGSVSLVVSWFGDDLRCNACQVMPRVDQNAVDGVGMPWSVNGVTRGAATPVSLLDGRPVFGGTQTDASVVEAIKDIRAHGQEVMFYPFLLMDIQAGNALTDPWGGAGDQPVMPWRGRITLATAPGQTGTSDQTASAQSEVAAFFGTATAADFVPGTNSVSYTGPAEWSYRRFILHYAHLCALAGGVDSFCIGSELRSLTQIRGGGGSFPAVDALIALAGDVRAILGANTKIGYAADWSEYFGYHPQDGSNDVLFHLDALWSDPNIDFIGIDNYMPLSDWRDEGGHADAGFGSIYDLGYLTGNIEGGEGYDWYYESDAARDHQNRTPINDNAHGEHWIFRYKDIRNWWMSSHHERIGGVRQSTPTAWVPQGKPVWFTEYGCAAIDKATNQPNAFLDAKSSESQKPHYSNGVRDDLIQAQYLSATSTYWNDASNNPPSAVYDGPMIDMNHAHVWAWDARPWPEFPSNLGLWSDGVNYARGHWLNGRIAAQSLADIVSEICETSNVTDLDLKTLHGSVTGYTVGDTGSGRSALQPLMMAFGVEAAEQDGLLRFFNRSADPVAVLTEDQLVWTGQSESALEATRQPDAETAGLVRIKYIHSDGNYDSRAAEAIFADETALSVSESELPVVMSAGRARGTAERWLAENKISRETMSLALPPSQMALGAGDIVTLRVGSGDVRYRIDRVEDVGERRLEAVRVDPAAYAGTDDVDDGAAVSDFVPPLPVFPVFLDLPLLTGAENPVAPHIAVTATPWPGSAAVFSSPSDNGYRLNKLVENASIIGVTQTPLSAAEAGRWDNGPGVRVKVFGGSLASATRTDVLNGANTVAIGSGSDDVWEVFQFSDANLVAGQTYDLTGLLRGQVGTDALMPNSWPIGSYVVALDGRPLQIDLADSARNLARHYRTGPAQRDYTDPTYQHDVRAFAGIGLRPLSPSHLKAETMTLGDRAVTWVRRTRIDGDNWASPDVPLGEGFESYLVRVRNGPAVVRETTVNVPWWTYTATDQVSDGVTGQVTVEVAQISERFGAGLFARIDINV